MLGAEDGVLSFGYFNQSKAFVFVTVSIEHLVKKAAAASVPRIVVPQYFLYYDKPSPINMINNTICGWGRSFPF